MIAQRIAAIAFASSICAVGHAGPPFLTDDPEPVDLYHTEVNLALQRTRADAGTSGTVAVDINFGCAHETQCHFAVPGAFANAPGQGMHAGIGDIELGAKYRFLNEPDRGFMAAVYPTAFLPTGDASRGLGNGRMQLLLPVWLQQSAGAWTWDAGVAYLSNPAAGARNNWFVGFLAQRSFSERLKVGAEVFHRTPVAQDMPATTAFNVGITVKVNDNRNLLAAVGRGLQGPGSNRSSMYLALQLEL